MKKSTSLFLFILVFLYAQENENKDTHMDSLFGVINPAPERKEGEGPFKRLIIRGATLIDGTGAPPRGPVDIVVEGNKISRVASVGTPFIKINDAERPKNASYEIEAEGMYVMPGLVDLHTHLGDSKKAPNSEYVFKLWLGHGITTVRGVPLADFESSLLEKARSEKNEITAPRIFNYPFVSTGGPDWKGGEINDPVTARKWVKYISRRGADGMKLFSLRPDIMAALLDEAKNYQLGSTAHLAQTGVAQMNAIDAARLGLGTVTHFYGLFESMYESNDIQPWPVKMNYNDEQFRFGQVARQWNLVEPGGEKWTSLLDEFLELKVSLDPTMTIYAAGRDVMRARNADWHEEYTLPSLWEFFTPSRVDHGSYFFDWTTWDEVAWRNYYRIWMKFLNDYKNMGGRVTTGSDSGFIYKLFGFGTIEEMELLQEAGFHPLEVIRSATMYGAETLYQPSGKPIEFGVIRSGMKADMLIVDENPIANLKVLYGTGAVKLNDETGEVERVGGVKYTIKDGIVYDAQKLLEDVRAMVKEQKRELGDRILH